jgi:hypothetical protein
MQSTTEMDSTAHFIPLGPMSSSNWNMQFHCDFSLMWGLVSSISGDINYLELAVEEIVLVS